MSVNIIGFKEFEGKLNRLPKQVIDTANAYVFDAAKEWEQLAKRSAPVDKGALVGRIKGSSTGVMKAEVVSPVIYSPYREWGTGLFVSVPADLASYAIQFKGKKQIKGSNGKPFLFIHKEPVKIKLFNRIQKLLSTPR